MSTGSVDPPGSDLDNGEPAAPSPPPRIHVLIRNLVARPRRTRSHGPVGQLLLLLASSCTTYTAGWGLLLLHGPARMMTLGGASTAFLLGSALWRRGWLG